MTERVPVTSDIPVMVILPVPTLVTLTLLKNASEKRLNWLPTEKLLLSKPTDKVAEVVELLVTMPLPAREPMRALLPFKFRTVPLDKLNCENRAPAPEAPITINPPVTFVAPEYGLWAERVTPPAPALVKPAVPVIAALTTRGD